MSVLRDFRDKIIRQIAPGEVFVPEAECSTRGQTSQREGYMQAHIVVFGNGTNPADIGFEAICMPNSSAHLTLEPYDEPSTRNTRKRKGMVAFGEPVATTKGNEPRTLNMAKIIRSVR